LEAWDQGLLQRVENQVLGLNPIGLDGIRALCRMYAAGKLRKHEMRIDIGSKSGVVQKKSILKLNINLNLFILT
jgi:hypothetical protein